LAVFVNILKEIHFEVRTSNLKTHSLPFIFLLSVCIFCIFSLSACSFVPANEIKADLSYSGKEVTLSQFGPLTVTLESDNPSGSIWIEKANIRDSLILELKDHKYIPAETPIPGATGSEIWIFNSPHPGKTSLSMEYRAPYTGAIIYKTFDLTVKVVGK
jgi:predicted secreted protein